MLTFISNGGVAYLILVRPMTRSFTAAIVAILLLSMSNRAWASPIQLQSADPPVDGKKYLLSDAEFHAALAAARLFFATVGAPFGKVEAPIYRITVVSPTEVRVCFDWSPESAEGMLILERSGNGWRVAGIEWSPGHRRPNQPMQLTPSRTAFTFQDD
jgi:hypothetical protein